MLKLSALSGLLLLSSALVAPSVACAQAGSGAAGGGAGTATGASTQSSTPQTAPTTPGATPAQAVPSTPDQGPGNPTAGAPAADDTQQGAAPDVSIPGGGATTSGDVVVTGRRNSSNSIIRNTTQVTSLLSAADIARTGEGNIAGALSRVTGLSLVGNGLVFVRGLGDRYSLALLNGSPLPSPEPLRRVIPLDLFPTSVIASSLVQKSYSANFPGEFGGGVINLTTIAAPRKSFLTVGGNVGWDSETTHELGYSYYGSKTDWTGFDNGNRDYTPALASFLASGKTIGDPGVDQQAVLTGLATGRNSVVQTIRHEQPNFGATITGGTTYDLGWATLGTIITGGYSNRTQTRQTLQQFPVSTDLTQLSSNFNRIVTDNRIVVNGLIGLGLDFDPQNKIRWTTLYIRDTDKQTRLGVGTIPTTNNFNFLQQDTAWFERQLFDTQVAGDFKFNKLSVNVRGGWANTQRESPYEWDYQYVQTDPSADPATTIGGNYINRLNRSQGRAEVAFSDLSENLYSGGVDLSYALTPHLTATAGYALSTQTRDSSRRDFLVNPTTSLPDGVTFLRPDLLLEPAVIKAFNLGLIETTESAPAFRAHLRTDAGYLKLLADLTSDIRIDAGVRFEHGNETVAPIQVFTTTTVTGNLNQIERDYWLPAVTVTWQFRPDMQVRVNGGKTLARPQFRELLFQLAYDPDQNRYFQGNPLLTDSQLWNFEGRYEWYFAPDQRFSLSGFYKRINHPIEVFLQPQGDNGVITSFANAPRAQLYGAEAEMQKYFDLGDGLFTGRRAVAIANYTFSKSHLQVSDTDQVALYQAGTQPATNLFIDNAPLTGQSDHLANLEIGLEAKDHVSQQTFLLSYASKRVTSRGLRGFPDVYEHPGFRLDFVAREALTLGGIPAEAKFEVRNITGTDYQEYQQVGDQRAYYNRYKLGTVANLGLSVTF